MCETLDYNRRAVVGSQEPIPHNVGCCQCDTPVVYMVYNPDENTLLCWNCSRLLPHELLENATFVEHGKCPECGIKTLHALDYGKTISDTCFSCCVVLPHSKHRCKECGLPCDCSMDLCSTCFENHVLEADSSESASDDNYPPGCSDSDIDRDYELKAGSSESANCMECMHFVEWGYDSCGNCNADLTKCKTCHLRHDCKYLKTGKKKCISKASELDNKYGCCAILFTDWGF